jgi:hypothetical protein
MSCSTDHKNKLKAAFYNFSYHIDFLSWQLVSPIGINHFHVHFGEKERKNRMQSIFSNSHPQSPTSSESHKQIKWSNYLKFFFKNCDVVLREILSKK